MSPDLGDLVFLALDIAFVLHLHLYLGSNLSAGQRFGCALAEIGLYAIRQGIEGGSGASEHANQSRILGDLLAQLTTQITRQR